jgi:lysyl-tRNA synthetase, class II
VPGERGSRRYDQAVTTRREKLDRLAESPGSLAYEYHADHSAADVVSAWSSLAAGERSPDRVSVAGRLLLIRRHGGLIFAVLHDRSGQIQLFADRAALGPEQFAAFAEFDRGDWVGAAGPVMRTDRGELSIALESFAVLGKALRPPPDKDKAFDDVEVRYRQRYVDLMVNESSRRIFDIRRRTIFAIRRYLDEHGYWEVEGPILGSIQGGATARPFITHHNALDIDLYLRIALELHLKRLVVGGMERVFELGRVFRNEGIDVRHNPEFTMLEAYQAFADYNEIMDLVEGMIGACMNEALDGNMVVQFGEQTIDLTPPWPRITLSDLIQQRLGVDLDPTMPVEAARKILDGLGVRWEDSWGSGKLMKQVVDDKIQHDIVNPIFVIDYPQEVSPLARVHRDRPGYVERFELMVAGFELCNAYSEQNDAAAQLAAFEAEARAKAQGDPEAGDIDLDYVRALEYGLPCTGGLGIGIDRLVMLLSGAQNIREVILFPTMRPEAGTGPTGPGGPGGSGRGSRALEPAIGSLWPPTPAPIGAPVRPASEPRRIATPTERRAERRRLRLLGGFASLGGLILLLTLVPLLHSRVRPFGTPIGPTWFQVTGHLVTLLLGLGLLFLAGQLMRGKRRAWQLAVVLFGVGVVTNILKGPHPISTLYCAVMVVALVTNRRAFRASADPPSLLRLLRLVPFYVAVVFTFGFVSLAIERRHLDAPLTFSGGLQTIVKGLVYVHGPYTYTDRFFGSFFPKALLLLGAAGILGALYLLFRPLRARAPHTERDWDHARDLVRGYGSDTLAYFALRDDKSFFFSSDGQVLIAYTYLAGFALVSGDPIGRPSSIDAALDEFIAFCGDRSWRIAFLAARDTEVPRYASRGFRSFYLGDEAIVECLTFSLDGPDMKGIRSAVRRVAKTHHFQLLRESDASAELVRDLNQISEQWRGKAPERGFTMSLSQDIEGDGRNRDFLLCIAFDESGRPGGFLRIVPVYGDDFGYTLDLMRHVPDAPNGMTEFLISETALALAPHGINRLSMNFAMWGRLYEKDVPYSLPQRLAKRAVDLMNPFFQIKSLHDFNAKFHPQWLSRVLIYQEPTDLPRVGLLYAGAEGFLAIPGIGDLFVPKQVGGVSSAEPPVAA